MTSTSAAEFIPRLASPVGGANSTTNSSSNAHSGKDDAQTSSSSSSSSSLALRDCQIQSLVHMLHFMHVAADTRDAKGDWEEGNGHTANGNNENDNNNDDDDDGENEPIWKVLVYDRFGQDVLSPLLKVTDLREHAVTLHLTLHSDREGIPDVPAIYFMEATQENIRRLCQDLGKGLYESFHIHFLSSVPRHYLEELASYCVQKEVSSRIVRIFDQYLNFITLERYMFSLSLRDAFVVLNNPAATDQDIEQMVDKIVAGLFSVCVTLEQIPIIRCPRGNAAAMVAQKLDQKLRNHMLNSRSNLFSDGGGLVYQQRPVLLLLDRTMDIVSMVSHTWNYQTLVHEILDLKLNQVTIETEDNGRKTKKNFELNIQDYFWKANAALPFPKVAENIDEEIARVKQDQQEVTNLSSSEVDSFSANTDNLKDAVSRLSGITEKKRIMDMHMNIASALLQAIKQRQLDSFFTLEEAITKQTTSAMAEVLRDQNKGTTEDKLRLFTVYYLTREDITDAEVDQLEAALRDSGCAIDALRYLKQIRTFGKAPAAPQAAPAASSSTADYFRYFGKGLTGGLMEGMMGDAVQMLRAGVKNLRNILPSDKTLPVTKVVDAVMDGRPGTEADSYLYFDPKSSKAADGSNVPRTKATYSSAIVFVVGGGNYKEYLNLVEWMQNSNGTKTVTYGSTEIINPQLFVAQLQELGSH